MNQSPATSGSAALSADILDPVNRAIHSLSTAVEGFRHLSTLCQTVHDLRLDKLEGDDRCRFIADKAHRLTEVAWVLALDFGGIASDLAENLKEVVAGGSA